MFQDDSVRHYHCYFWLATLLSIQPERISNYKHMIVQKTCTEVLPAKQVMKLHTQILMSNTVYPYVTTLDC
jgi:hypothetical protein